MSQNNITDGDYTLVDGAAWFTVDGISIRIHVADGFVSCDMYHAGDEMSPAVATCCAYAFAKEETK